MREAIIMMGLPGAGKTTVIHQQFSLKVIERALVSADVIKEELLEIPEFQFMDDYELHLKSTAMAEQEVYARAEKGDQTIIVDAGGINRNYTHRIIAGLRKEKYHIQLFHVRTPLHVCLERISKRERTIQADYDDVVQKYYKEGVQFHRLSELVDEVQIFDYFTYEHIFIDMDGVLCSQQVLAKVDGGIDMVNSEMFLHLKPVHPVIQKFRTDCDPEKLYILSGIPNSFSFHEKNSWLDRHFNIPPERRFFVNSGRHKAEMLDNLRLKHKLDKNQVVLVDDMHSTLLQVHERGMRPMHVSEFLTFDFKRKM